MNENKFQLEDISRLGEKYYLEELKDSLEAEHMGQYAVIDVEESEYEVDADRLVAVKKAQERFGEKLFYIVQIGMLKQSTMNYDASASHKKYAWNF